MAVPKRKTSKSRRDKRRATHTIERAEGQRLRDVRPAEAPAPRLPDLRQLQGPRGRAAPRPRSVESGLMARIAVDAMGGDRGPEAVVEGALAARADGIESRRLRLGGPRHARPRARAHDSGRRHGREAGRRVPHEGGQLARPRRQGRRGRRGRRGRVRRQHRSDARRRPRATAARPRRAAAGDRGPDPVPQRPLAS